MFATGIVKPGLRILSGIEKNYEENFVAKLATREKQIQQHYRPVISVHKWFARRPGSLFRSLVLAEFANGRVSATYFKPHEIDGVCLDPFMGGGTPVVEAARVGMSVIGYDTNPMARWIVERELEEVDPDELAQVGEAIAAEVEKTTRGLYVTDCPRCGDTAPVRYYIWIRHHRCAACSRETALLSDTMIVSTKLKRHPREVHVCPACLAVSEHRPGKRPERCRACRARYDAQLVPSGSMQMCECGTPFKIPPHDTVEEPCQKLVAVEYNCRTCSTRRNATAHIYKQADERDRARYREAEQRRARLDSPYWPNELIPDGHETRRLLNWGYLTWRDLFNARQLYGLALLAARINDEPNGAIKRALQTVFSDTLRYQNMLCRYDRQGLKPSDVFSLHSFPVPRVICEVALVGAPAAGSGGFRHGLAKYIRAKHWCQAPTERKDNRRIATAPEKVASVLRRQAAHLRGREAFLKRGSLAHAELAPESVDLVLTDPPYFKNVQYAELIDFCYVWLRRLAPTAFFRLRSAKTADDAVGADRGAAVDIVEFTRRLSGVFVAAARALKADGAFCFTYHHNEIAAYVPLIVGALDAGLVPTAVFACPSEMRSSTHIYERNAATIDTLFVLRKRGAGVAAHKVADVGEEVARHVAAMRRAGLDVADADRDCLRSGQLTARAMIELASSWLPAEPLEERFARAQAALIKSPAKARRAVPLPARV